MSFFASCAISKKWRAIRSFANHYGATQGILPFPIRPSSQSEEWRCQPDSNRRIRVLQTLALPLGDGTIYELICLNNDNLIILSMKYEDTNKKINFSKLPILQLHPLTYKFMQEFLLKLLRHLHLNQGLFSYKFL